MEQQVKLGLTQAQEGAEVQTVQTRRPLARATGRSSGVRFMPP
jgi:hypothetical protein